MPESSDKEIERIRNEWEMARESHHRWLSLIGKRDALESKINELEHEIEEMTLAAHQRYADDRDSLEIKLQEMRNKQILLNTLKDKKREIDDLLDSLENITEEIIENLENQLLDRMSAKSTSSEKIQLEELRAAIQLTASQQKALESTCQLYEKLEEYLQQVKETRQDIRKRGIFSYIFGPSPNWVITKHLQSAAALINSALPKLNEMAAGLASDEALVQDYKDSIEFVKLLHENCSRRWGFRHVDELINTAMPTLQNHLEKFKAHRMRLQRLEGSHRARLELMLRKS